MKLLLRRNQKTGMFGGSIKFVLEARAELTDEEQENVRKYKMGKEILYHKDKVDTRGIEQMGNMKAIWKALAAKALNVDVTIGDLVHGKEFECKDIVEMIGIEEDIKEACQTFKRVLETAASFGGEEIIDLS